MTNRFFRLLTRLRVPDGVYYWLLDLLTDNDGWRPLTMRDPRVGTVTVTLELDTSAFDRSMQIMSEHLRRISYENRLRMERNRARRELLALVTDAWGRYGWDWPGPVVDPRPVHLVAWRESDVVGGKVRPVWTAEVGPPVHTPRPNVHFRARAPIQEDRP